jgi:hypothetical protein
MGNTAGTVLQHALPRTGHFDSCEWRKEKSWARRKDKLTESGLRK